MVFDELHKYRSWRSMLKGLYDKRSANQRILVTGSARLDLYRHGGDSLQGRYHLLRLHPLSVAELGLKTSAELEGLLRLGGFPEPYFGSSETQARRWSREYRTRLIREDVVDLERIADLGNLDPGIVAQPVRNALGFEVEDVTNPENSPSALLSTSTVISMTWRPSTRGGWYKSER